MHTDVDLHSDAQYLHSIDSIFIFSLLSGFQMYL